MDAAILHMLRENNGGPLPLWTVVNQVARLFAPRLFWRPRKRQRTEVKQITLKRLCAMIHAGKVARVQRKYICLPERRTFVSANVRHLSAERRGSTVTGRRTGKLINGKSTKGLPRFQLCPKPKANEPAPSSEPKPVVPHPSAEEIRAAAEAMASIPRGRRRPWTGYLGGRRIRRLSLVRVPGGAVLPVRIIRRNRVYVLLPDEPQFALQVYKRYDASQVQLAKHPAAVVLGRLKRGIRELHSTLKVETARRNGRQPCHPGRRRGRPVKSQPVGVR